MDSLDTALDGDLHGIVELSSLAPSVHNTQPWSFTWDGTAFSVYEDPSRALPVLDPTGRERLISCGAAILNARAAFAGLGYRCGTTVSPDPDEPELLARITVQGRKEPSEQELALAGAIARRTTDRDPFDDRPVPEAARTALMAAAEREGGWVRFLREDGENEAVEVQVLLSHADSSQRSDPAYLAELAAWRNERLAEGVPARALPSVPAELRGATWVPRDFDAATASHPVARTPADAPPPKEHPSVLVLGTSGDTRQDWLTAGQALGLLLLRATVDGLAAQPLTQVLEVPLLRSRMRHALGVVGHPQMLLRLGYGHTGPTSRRRPPEQTVTLVSPSGGQGVATA